MAYDFSTEKGVIVYDSFDFDKTNFSVAIRVTIDSLQYWRDRPLYISTTEPLLQPAFDIQEDPNNYLKYLQTDYPVGDYLAEIGKMQEYINQNNETILDYTSKIDEYSELSANEDLDIDYGQPEPDPQVIEIKDKDGNVIKTIPVDVNERQTTEDPQSPTGERAISYIDNVPPEFSDDDILDDVNAKVFQTMDESFIKDKMAINDKYIPQFTDAVNQSQENLSDGFNSIAQSIEDIRNENKPGPLDKDELVPPGTPNLSDSFIDSITKPYENWLAIPLIDLDDLILQLNKERKIEVFPLGFYIDKVVPPGSNFITGVTIQNGMLQLFLKIDNDPQLYIETTIAGEINPKLKKYGADKDNRKQMQGYIWDVYFWPYPREFDFGIRLYYPNDTCYFFQFLNQYITGDLIYPICNYHKPAHFAGTLEIVDNQTQKFKDGVIDRFFCRKKFTNSFTFNFAMYITEYQNGEGYIVSDMIHSNFIYYDFDNMCLKVDFNGRHFIEYITLPLDTYFSFNIIYDKLQGILYISIYDFKNDLADELSFKIGRDLEFELIVLFAYYSKTQKKYIKQLKNTYIYYLSFWDKLKPKEDLYELLRNQTLYFEQLEV